MRTGYADFWELYRRNVLPGETKNYVPGIIAAIIMAKNPEQYGLDKVVPDTPVVSDTVTVDYAIDLRLVADVTNSSLAEIVALNPSLLRMTTPRDLPFDLHIPVGTRDVFAERIKEIPEDKRNSWRFHIVRAGETVDGIAAALHARASDVATTNELSLADGVDAGDELVVPVTSAVAGAGPQRYKVRRGDTLVTVADRFGTSVEALRQWNHLSSNVVRPGISLAVAEPVKLAPVTHVRSRRARTKNSLHPSTASVHAASAHTETKRTTSKVGTSSTTPKKTSALKKQNPTSKMK
jgi:membrane-bound lytic murein transglycosylase D